MMGVYTSLHIRVSASNFSSHQVVYQERRGRAVVVETALGTYITREKVKLSRLLQVLDPSLDHAQEVLRVFLHFV